MCGKSEGPPANGASLDRYLNGQFVKMGCCQTAQTGPILNKFWSELIKFNLSRDHFHKKMAAELQSHRVAELQTPKGTQYTGE